MGKSDGLRRSATAMVCAVTTAAISAWSHDAGAFALKHTSQGKPLRWGMSQVTYVVDPSMDSVSGGIAAVSSAIGVWSAVAGGPVLSVTPGAGAAQPGLDGQNSVLFAPHGFPAAGDALAVTVTSYDDTTGTIVDSDIVINGIHAFAVLAADAKADSDAKPVSTDGAAGDEAYHRGRPCDLVHVVSHEVGHTMGVADERDNPLSLMYAFTSPGDASIRSPSGDDIDAITALYGASGSAPGSTIGRSGCGVAGSKTDPDDAWGAMALIAGACLWLGARHRVKGARAMVPFGAALVALVAYPAPARSAAPFSAFAADSIARVIGASTSNQGGLFETTLELIPIACRHDPCPARARAHVWGGTVNGITQRIGVGDSVPLVGEVVDIAFLRSKPTQVQLAAVVPMGGSPN